MRPGTRHWLHPQTVPRGFLRMYILTLLSRGPESGYSIMQKIDERTEGAWRPGAGTMYPLLKALADEGLVRTSIVEKGSTTRAYSLTPRGRRVLDSMRQTIAGLGRKERVMARLFSDLLSGEEYVDVVVNRFREGAEVFRRKVGEVEEPRRSTSLSEFRMLLEGQVAWIDSQLGPPNKPRSPPVSRRRRGA